MKDFTAYEGHTHWGIRTFHCCHDDVISSEKRGCSARCGGPVAMATAGVKDGGWWLACGVCGQNERQPASQHCFKGKYDRNERRCRIDSAKEVKRKGKKKKKKDIK